MKSDMLSGFKCDSDVGVQKPSRACCAELTVTVELCHLLIM